MAKRHSIQITLDDSERVADFAVQLGQRFQGRGIVGITEIDVTRAAVTPNQYTVSWFAPALSTDGGRQQVVRAIEAEGGSVVETQQGSQRG